MNSENEEILRNEIEDEDPASDKESKLVEMSEKDQRLAEEMELKIEKLRNFTPSGDIWDDCNSMLELSGRDAIYKKADKDIKPEEVLSGLMGLRACWKSMIKENPEKSESYNYAKKLYFIDLPQEEIGMVDRVIESYTSKFSGEEAKKYKKTEAFAETLYGNIGERSYQERLKNIENNDTKNEQELTLKDKKLCEEWVKEAENVKGLKISGDIAEDFNKFVELTDNDKLFNKVNQKENPNSVLLNFVKMQTTWENSLASHGTRPVVQKEEMKEIFLDCLSQKQAILNSFIEYYKIKQKL